MEYGYGLSREQYDRLSALYREARDVVYPDGVPVYKAKQQSTTSIGVTAPHGCG